MSENDTVIRISDATYCSTTDNDTIYGFFIDGEYLYHCFDKELAHFFLEDLVKDLETKFKKTHANYRVLVEKQNEWKYIIQRVRDGIILSGKPKLTHTVEIKRSQKLLKPECPVGK